MRFGNGFIKALYHMFSGKGLCFCTLLTLTACSTQTEPKVQNGYYHWKSKFAPTDAEKQVIEHQLDKLYLRVFDVVVQADGVSPEAIVQFTDTVPAKVEVVPVVYITNQVMLQAPEPGLAQKVAELILYQYHQVRSRPLHEVQIDCDWTQQSRSHYFQFLEELKTHLPKGTILSVTIRLHQFKDPNGTGVPIAAHRGMLMLYNTGQITAIDETNSILTVEAARKWLQGAKTYPLPLDAVLPRYSWAVVYRLGEFHHLMQGCTPDHLTDTSKFEALDNHRFLCKTTTLLDGYYLHPDDQIRIEAVPDSIAQQVWEMFREVHQEPVGCLAWFGPMTEISENQIQ